MGIWQITFSECTFLKLLQRIRNKRKILLIFDIHMLKKIQNSLGSLRTFEYFWDLVERKFAKNCLTNWKTFLTNIVKNIIWHLFAGKSHPVVKTTVT
jgi:hypothetical protein